MGTIWLEADEGSKGYDLCSDALHYAVLLYHGGLRCGEVWQLQVQLVLWR